MANLIIAGVLIALAIGCLAYVIKQQQETIERLTEKIMARDYTDYRRGQAPVVEERESRKPMSYYDDPSFE